MFVLYARWQIQNIDRQLQLHSLIAQLDSQLTQVYIDAKGLKQKNMEDYFE
jgi:hypothetical protein